MNIIGHVRTNSTPLHVSIVSVYFKTIWLVELIPVPFGRAEAVTKVDSIWESSTRIMSYLRLQKFAMGFTGKDKLLLVIYLGERGKRF